MKPRGGISFIKQFRCFLDMTSTAASLFQGSEHSALYAKFRPVAPISLVQDIIKYHGTAENKLQTCVDVGCGSGQFTQLLIPFSHHIIGQDISPTQIKEAKEIFCDSNIEFRVGSAESIDIPDSSVDLVTISQALHWVQVEEFYKEVDRILVPGGTLAVVGYQFTCPHQTWTNNRTLKDALHTVYSETKDYWSSERRLVDNEYHDIPQADLKDYTRKNEHFTSMNGSLADWIGYISTWSGYQSLRKKEGDEVAGQVLNRFKQDCLNILGKENQNPADISLDLRTRFWLIMYKK
ncbi:putative methyltransferase DDB_G0268948 isoform X2 [Eurytemora carolleeae]|uniref:putative methyltransferase DDB_G0268948 isoform X2 n=1 Tax=Eurytemora carolleeae TaxID=1294199 RepID=UPI000C779849|nr:putative methyltransferase DDB_G0268948 isoform X2 [Eurytemora carolleeae]|eukprot:XP_023326515.1 putative methyltransferase DDB_G0268948 isoform X2 [Eurytemora affinis]